MVYLTDEKLLATARDSQSAEANERQEKRLTKQRRKAMAKLSQTIQQVRFEFSLSEDDFPLGEEGEFATMGQLVEKLLLECYGARMPQVLADLMEGEDMLTDGYKAKLAQFQTRKVNRKSTPNKYAATPCRAVAARKDTSVQTEPEANEIVLAKRTFSQVGESVSYS